MRAARWALPLVLVVVDAWGQPVAPINPVAAMATADPQPTYIPESLFAPQLPAPEAALQSLTMGEGPLGETRPWARFETVWSEALPGRSTFSTHYDFVLPFAWPWVSGAWLWGAGAVRSGGIQLWGSQSSYGPGCHGCGLGVPPLDLPRAMRQAHGAGPARSR